MFACQLKSTVILADVCLSMLSVAPLPIGAPGPLLPWLNTDMEQVTMHMMMMLLMSMIMIMLVMMILMIMGEIRVERIHFVSNALQRNHEYYSCDLLLLQPSRAIKVKLFLGMHRSLLGSP